MADLLRKLMHLVSVGSSLSVILKHYCDVSINHPHLELGGRPVDIPVDECGHTRNPTLH
jgi:hypothetical protein